MTAILLKISLCISVVYLEMKLSPFVSDMILLTIGGIAGKFFSTFEILGGVRR